MTLQAPSLRGTFGGRVPLRCDPLPCTTGLRPTQRQTGGRECVPCPGQTWVQAGRHVSLWVRWQGAMHGIWGCSPQRGLQEEDRVGKQVVGGTGAGRFLGMGAQVAGPSPVRHPESSPRLSWDVLLASHETASSRASAEGHQAMLFSPVQFPGPGLPGGGGPQRRWGRGGRQSTCSRALPPPPQHAACLLWRTWGKLSYWVRGCLTAGVRPGCRGEESAEARAGHPDISGAGQRWPEEEEEVELASQDRQVLVLALL